MEQVKLRRVSFIDELRGLSILLMVAYHAVYDMIYIFGFDIPVFHSLFLKVAQPVVAGTFILMSGIACRYSKNNAARGVKTLALGLLLTAFTFIFIREQAIYFGILHFMGTAMLLFALFKPALDKLSPFGGMLASSAFFAFTYNLPAGYLGFRSLFSSNLPALLYEKSWLFPIGFGGAGADYFPIFPWLFLFFAGSYAGIYFVNGSMPDWFYVSHSRPLAYVGRHTLVIYILHQPVIMGILMLALRFAA